MPSTLSVLLVSSVANGPTGGSFPVITGRRSLSSGLFSTRSSIASFHTNVFVDRMNRFGLKGEGGASARARGRAQRLGRRHSEAGGRSRDRTHGRGGQG